MFEKMLVCLDGSKLSEQIFPYAREQAIRFRSKVVLMHVVGTSALVSPAVPGTTAMPIMTSSLLERMQEEENEANAYLESLAGPLRESGLEVEIVIKHGAAGDVIIDYAINNDIDLIALATHGRSGVIRTVFGSVADQVMRQSGLPILMIKPQESGG